MTYNHRGRLIRVTDALSHVTEYSYNFGGCGSCGSGGNLLAAVNDPGGSTVRFGYDDAGWRIRETDL